MAFSSYPFENIDTSETEFSRWSRNFNDGVKGTPLTTDLKPFADASGLNVKIYAGQALVRGHYFFMDATEILTISTPNATLPRIDAVVLELDPAFNSIVPKVIPGTPNAIPVAPTLTQTDSGVFQQLLGTVAVSAAASTISNGNVTDLRLFMGQRFGIWTTASRPTNPVAQTTIGYNTTLNIQEYWDGSAWVGLIPTIPDPPSAFLLMGA